MTSHLLVSSRSSFLTLFFSLALGSILSSCNDEEPAPATEIYSVLPSSGEAGTIVTIRGKNFKRGLSENLVKFSGVPAVAVLSASDSILEVVTPGGSTSGPVEVVMKGGTTVVGPEFKFYDVYSYGRNNYSACYWKNGTPVVFNERGHLVDFAISGSDVHAVGFNFTNLGFEPGYWKNGVLRHWQLKMLLQHSQALLL